MLIFTCSDADPPETATPVEVVRHPRTRSTSPPRSRHLRAERGVRALLCEGGPRLHAQLIDAGLIDELFVTHAPKLAGGAGPGLVDRAAPSSSAALELAWLLAEPTASCSRATASARLSRARSAGRHEGGRRLELGISPRASARALAAAQHPQGEDRRRRAAPRGRG